MKRWTLGLAVVCLALLSIPTLARDRFPEPGASRAMGAPAAAAPVLAEIDPPALPGNDDVQNPAVPELPGLTDEAIRVVAAFLQLSPDQGEQWGTLLQQRRQDIAPLQRELKQVQEDIKDFIDSNDDLAVGGELLLEAAALRAEIAEAQGMYVQGFVNILDDDQLKRLRAVRVANDIERVLPAFRRMALVGKPGPRPGR